MRWSALGWILIAVVLTGCQSTGTPSSTPAAVRPVTPAATPGSSPAAPAPSLVAKPSPVAAPSPSAAPFSGPLASLTVSYSNVIADNLSEWMALEAGIFEKHGLKVELQNIPSSTGVPALLSGQVQIAQLGGSEVLSAAAGGGDLVILGNLSPVYPFVFMVPAEIASVEQIKGKKIGVSNIGSSSDIATRVMLKKLGLDPSKDVEIVAVGSLQNRIAALTNGAIQGGLAQPPDQLVLQDKGFHVVYDLAQQKLPAANTAITVQRSWLNANRDVAQRYIDALVEAIARDRADRSLALDVLKKYLQNDDRRALETTYDFFVGQVTPQYPAIRQEQFNDSVEQLSASNERLKTFDVSSILDTTLVQSAIDRHVGAP